MNKKIAVIASKLSFDMLMGLTHVDDRFKYILIQEESDLEGIQLCSVVRVGRGIAGSWCLYEAALRRIT